MRTLFFKIENIIMIDKIKTYFKNGKTSWKIIFWICLSVSIVLIIASFLLPPMGFIDSSVLEAVAALLGFPTIYSILEVIESGREFSFKYKEIEMQSTKNEDN